MTLNVWREPPPKLQGPCDVLLTAKDDGGGTETRAIHQFAFPDRFEEHYGGPDGWFTRFERVIVGGEVDLLADPLTWVLMAQYAADPIGAAKELGMEQLLQEIGLEIPDVQIMLYREAGEVVGIDLNGPASCAASCRRA